jgi:hypothetical protein
MLIALGGKARSGKDTVAKMLIYLLYKELDIEYYTRAYADELKEMLIRDLDLSYEQVYGNLKEVEDKRYPKDHLDILKGYWTPREFLQHFGTEVYRRIDPLFWVNKLKLYVQKRGYNCIITDCRFVNEVTWIKDLNGIYIRIDRNKSGAKQGKDHKSETNLLESSLGPDIIINNNFETTDELFNYLTKNIVSKILIKIGEQNG